MTVISLRTLLRGQPDAAVQGAVFQWCGNGVADGDRRAWIATVAAALEDEQRVGERLRELPSKLSDLLDVFLAEPGRARAVQELFAEQGQEFKSRFDLEASLAALHREGFLFPAPDGVLAEPGYAVPAELAQCVQELRRRQQSALQDTLTLRGFLEASYFRGRDQSANGDTKADAERAIDHARKIYKFYLMENSIRGRVGKLPESVKDVFLLALTRYGGLMPAAEMHKELDPEQVPDLDLCRKCLEEGMLGTVASLPMSRFGLQPADDAVVVFHEIALIGLRLYSGKHEVEVDSAMSAGVDVVSNVGRFLRELSSSKVQFTVDGKLYKASEKRIARTFMEIPGGFMPNSQQIGFIFRFCLARRLIDRSGERALRPTSEGMEFDRRELQEKLRSLLSYCVEERALPGEPFHQVRLRRVLLRLLKRSEPDQWYETLFLPFLARNTYLTQLDGERAGEFFAARFKGGGYVPTENLQQLCWNLLLFVKRRLFPLGIVDLGLKDGRLVAIRLSRLGAELLGAEPAGQLGGARSSVVVNPDFEVILFPGEDEHEVVHTFDRFARRVKSDHIHHFKLDRETVQAGMRDGLMPSQIVQELTDRSRAPLPQNVVYSLEDWADDAGLVVVEKGTLVRSRRAEVLTRFLSLPSVEPHVADRRSENEARLREGAPLDDLAEAVRDHGFVLDCRNDPNGTQSG